MGRNIKDAGELVAPTSDSSVKRDFGTLADCWLYQECTSTPEPRNESFRQMEETWIL